MKVINKNIEILTPYKNNAKKHSEKQIAAVAESIKRFGWQQPIVVDKDDTVIIGHCRLLAAQQLGLTEVPVVVAENLTKAEIKALRIADNKTNESDWDNDLLGIDIKEIFSEIDMTDFGFSDFEISMFTEDFEPEPYDDALIDEYAEHADEFLKKKRVMITYTEEEEDALCEFLGVERDKLKVVYNFAELKKE